MKHVLDQTEDINGQQLYRLSKLYGLPPFVKRASSEDIYGTDDLQNHQYGDIVKRRFPCHTSAATYVSTLFFLEKKAELDKYKANQIEDRLNHFAEFHGISERISALKDTITKSSANNIEDLDDDCFAVVLSADISPSGAVERHYPLRNSAEIKKAAEYLHATVKDIPYKYRQDFARNVLDKAEQHGTNLENLEEFLHKQAGYGGAASQDIAELLFERARLLKRAYFYDYAETLGEMAKSVLKDPSLIADSDRLVKLASIVDDIDRETGLNKEIEDLRTPEDVFFRLNEKVARQVRSQHLSTTSGNIYKLADFNKLKLSDVKSMMGEDFSDAVSAGGLMLSTEKLAEIVPTLPLPDAELFDNLLASVGIRPIVKEAAHYDPSFSAEHLVALAALHKTN